MRDLLEKAVALDPEYARAQAMLAFVYQDEYRWKYNPHPDRPAPLKSALTTARLAVRLDPADAYTHYALAKVLFFDKQLDRFEQEAAKALEFNPNFADAMADFGIRFANMGQIDRGVALTREAMRLNPFYPGWYHFTFVTESYLRGDYERTIAETKKINWPDSFWTYAMLAVAYGQLDRKEDARGAVKELLRLYPNFPQDYRDRMLDDMNIPPPIKARWLEGLTKAGAFDEPAVK